MRVSSGDSQRPPRLAVAICILGAGLLIAALAAQRLADPDLPWHLATGRSIWLHRGIPRLDDLAFTHRPVRYTALVDLPLYAVARAFGALGLQAAAGIVAAAIGAVSFLSLRRHGPIGLVVAALVLAALNPWLRLRPAEISLLFLALALWAIDLHRRGPQSIGGRRALFALVPLQLAWANTHGFAVMGAALALGYAGYRAACRVARGRLGGWLPERDGSALGATGLAAAAALGATMLNPLGPRLLLATARANEQLGGVAMWTRTTPEFLMHHERLGALIVALGVVAIAFGRDADGRRAPSLWDAGLSAAGVVLLFSVVRMIPIAAMLCAPAIARRLGGLVRPSRAMWICCALSALAPGGLALCEPAAPFGVGFDASWFPVRAAAWAAERRPAGRMWNYWPWGGYLAWRLGPGMEVFADGRNTLAREAALERRAQSSVLDDRALSGVIREFDLQWAMTRSYRGDTPLFAADPDWTMVYLDEQAAIYVKRRGDNAALAARGFRLLRHAIAPGLVLDRAVQASAGRRGPDAADLSHDGALAAAQDPQSARAAFLDGCGAIAARDRQRLAFALTRLHRLAPGDPTGEALAEAWQVVQTQGLSPLQR